MATSAKNLSLFNSSEIPSAKKFRFGIVVAEWNADITTALYEGAYTTLLQQGALKKNIKTLQVPGSFELTHGAQILAKNKNIDAVICLGCVIKGETPHFEYICQAIAYGITELTIKHVKPVIFGVLTTNTEKQAIERTGGKHGNKGCEAAITAIKMLNIR